MRIGHTGEGLGGDWVIRSVFPLSYKKICWLLPISSLPLYNSFWEEGRQRGYNKELTSDPHIQEQSWIIQWTMHYSGPGTLLAGWMRSPMLKQVWSNTIPVLLHFCRTQRRSLSFSGKPAPAEKSSCSTEDLHSTHNCHPSSPPHPAPTVTLWKSLYLIGDTYLQRPWSKGWFICRWRSFKTARAGRQ